MAVHGSRIRGTSAALLPLLLALACGGRQTTASKSATAYDEARRTGAPVAKGQGHGHAADEQDPSAASHGSHPAHDDAAHDVAREQPAASGRGTAPSEHGGHPPSQGHGRPLEVDHSRMDHAAAMDHSDMAHAQPSVAPPAPKPEQAAAEAPAGGPASSLRADPLDSPVPTAVAESERAAGLADEMAAGGHGMHHGTYVQTDAGREGGTPKPEGVRPTPPPPDSHHDHGGAGPKARPSPRPTPTPRPQGRQ
jgi:hypothetical protein